MKERGESELKEFVNDREKKKREMKETGKYWKKNEKEEKI